jgi:hypothetical protein
MRMFTAGIVAGALALAASTGIAHAGSYTMD